MAQKTAQGLMGVSGLPYSFVAKSLAPPSGSTTALISPPPVREAMLTGQGLVTPVWARFFEDIYNLLK